LATTNEQLKRRDSAREPSAGSGESSFSARSGGPRQRFDPEPHREELIAIVREIEALPEVGPAELDGVLRRHPRDGKGFFSRSEIIEGYRAFATSAGFAGPEEVFLRKVQRRPVRSQSGVTPLTVLTKPFPCPGQCVYCPNDLRMPKSYLSDEPGAQRAANNRFDPYLQTWNRLAAFRATGHPSEKIELIVLGGTWSFYPESYQIHFVKRCLEAMNDFGSGIDGRDRAAGETRSFAGLGEGVDERGFSGPEYNKVVSDFLRVQGGDDPASPDESAGWDELEEVQRRNEQAICRNVGLSLETRPDYVTPDEVLRLRRLGCTKVQLGIQSLSDPVLDAIRRGHGVAESRAAIGLLRRAGFKIQAHWMPNLPASSPALDLEDYDRLFGDPDFRPDELKVYPCSLIESAELVHLYGDGRWRPYDYEELLEVVSGVLERTPRYCRLTRVIRDISSDDILVGNKLTNFREIAEKALEARGGETLDIRRREIRGEAFDADALELRATEYESSAGSDVFLELVTPEDRIVAFLRLTLPSRESFMDEIRASALIREVHVYGSALDLGTRSEERPQHRGFGARLVEEAARISRAAGFEELAVISAVGTRGYYRKLRFRDGALYQHRSL